ncbi:MAG: YtxH domain-containing protein [Bacteroidales bacterium]
MSTVKVIIGVIAGAAIGTALGILFAPDKGSTTRKKLVGKTDKYVDELEDKFNEFIDGITKEYEILKEEAIRMEEKMEVKEDDAKVYTAAQ